MAVLGFAVGALWREQAHAGWKADREAALARADSVGREAERIRHEWDGLRDRADSLGREAQHLEAITRRQVAEATRARMALATYRDSVAATGDTMVPLARLHDAIAVIDSQQVALGTQRALIRTLAADTATLAAAGRLAAIERDAWKGAAEELEQVLKDYRAPSRPKLLGLLPAPSPTVTFLVGAVVGVVATR